jgi:3-methyladenine DNA glycosylase/8-oxoguanine DNA glycosylase
LVTSLAAPLDFPATFALQQLGRDDPSATLDERHFSKLFLNAAGQLETHRFVRRDLSLSIEIDNASALARWESQLAQAPAVPDIVKVGTTLRRLALAFPSMRIVSMPWMFDVAAGAVLQQRVKFYDAAASFRTLALRFGERRASATAFPSVQRIAGLPSYEFRAANIDAARARALVHLAREELRRPFLFKAGDFTSLRRRLLAIPGIGPWTTEMILGFGSGDADAVPVGDVHLPSLVSRVLGRGGQSSDDQMLKLLEPFAGHRFWVIRLLWMGVFHSPHLLGRHPQT